MNTRPRQCRKRQGAIAAVVVAFFFRLATRQFDACLSLHDLPRPAGCFFHRPQGPTVGVRQRA